MNCINADRAAIKNISLHLLDEDGTCEHGTHVSISSVDLRNYKVCNGSSQLHGIEAVSITQKQSLRAGTNAAFIMFDLFMWLFCGCLITIPCNVGEMLVV